MIEQGRYTDAVDEKINQILSITPHLRKSNKEIKDFIQNEKDVTKRAEYLKGIFNKDYTGVIVDDQMYGYKTFDNGILFWKGNFLSRDTESFVSWEDLSFHQLQHNVFYFDLDHNCLSVNQFVRYYLLC